MTRCTCEDIGDDPECPKHGEDSAWANPVVADPDWQNKYDEENP